MDYAVFLWPVIIAAILLALALNFRVQVAVIRVRPKGRPSLKRKIYAGGSICTGFGFLLLIAGPLIQLGLIPLATRTSWTPWMSASSVLFFSAGIPLLVQGWKLGKTGDDLKKFVHSLHTFGRTLEILAAVLLVAVVIIIIYIAIPFIAAATAAASQ
jgi:hypothetical protein